MHGEHSPNVDEIAEHYEQARRDFHLLLQGCSREDLRRKSNGTRWTNEQLLYHMVFGFTVVRALLPLIRFMSRMPRPVGRLFARFLDSWTGFFHWINYWGSVAGARVFTAKRLGVRMDRVTVALLRRLDREEDLSLGMPFPTSWDPFFQERMSLSLIYRYPLQHFEFHRRQLSIDG
jgi:hypothetical protein